MRHLAATLSFAAAALHSAAAESIWVDGVEYRPVDAGAGRRLGEEAALAPVGSAAFMFNAVAALICVCVAALAAGLTMGMLSLDPLSMRVVANARLEDCVTPEEREELRAEQAYIRRLLPLVSRHHLLLVTLLLMNSIANEALPLFLDTIVPSYVAVLLSVTFVLIFGEILPSSIFTGPAQLRIAASLAPLVYVLTGALYVVAAPISWLLDWWLGHAEEEVYTKAELKSLISLHGDPASLTAVGGGHAASRPAAAQPHSLAHSDSAPVVMQHSNSGSTLTSDELAIIHGALDLKASTARDAMIPLRKVFMLSIDQELDEGTMALLISVGHSRVPVYDGTSHNIRGVLMVKHLIALNPEARRSVRSLGLRMPVVIGPGMTLPDVLNEFQTGRSHLALVSDDPRAVRRALASTEPIPPDVHLMGIITIEDVLERLINEKIKDEGDSGVRETLAEVAFKLRRVERLKALVHKERERMAAEAVATSRNVARKLSRRSASSLSMVAGDLEAGAAAGAAGASSSEEAGVAGVAGGLAGAEEGERAQLLPKQK